MVCSDAEPPGKRWEDNQQSLAEYDLQSSAEYGAPGRAPRSGADNRRGDVPTEEERLWGGGARGEEGRSGPWERPVQRRPGLSEGPPGITELLREEEELANIPRKSRLEPPVDPRWAGGGGHHPFAGPTGQTYFGGRPDFSQDQHGGGHHHPFYPQHGEGHYMGNNSGGYPGDFGGGYGGGGPRGRLNDSFGAGYGGMVGGGAFNQQVEDFGWNPKAVKDYSAPAAAR